MFLKRHRILIVGDSGVGKTRAALSFAEEHLLQFPDAKVAVLDLDDSMTHEIEKFPMVMEKLVKPDNSTPHWFFITEYPQMLAAIVKIEQYLGRNDILIFEGLERGWELSQDHYTSEVFGKSSAEHLASLRQSRVAASRLEAPVSFDTARDWPSIRKMWKNEVLIPLTTATPWHIVATAAAKGIVLLNANEGTFNVNPYLKGIYGQTQVAPEGEKNDTKRFEMSVVLGVQGSKHIMTIVKNREKTGMRPANIDWTMRPFWATLLAHTEPAVTDPAELEETTDASVGA